jgi:hypothetical protein
MNVRITVEFAKAEIVDSRFVFICSREQDLGAGVDAAVTFSPATPQHVVVRRERVPTLREGNSLRRALAADQHQGLAAFRRPGPRGGLPLSEILIQQESKPDSRHQ